jgi:hypothetical protein
MRLTLQETDYGNFLSNEVRRGEEEGEGEGDRETGRRRGG